MASVTIHSFTAARAVVGKRHALPLGLYARFSATLQDDLGRVIDASSTQFVYRLSRYMYCVCVHACVHACVLSCFV